MKTRKIVLWGFLSLCLAGNAQARQETERNLVRDWSRSQQIALLGYDTFSVKASVRHTVETGSGARDAFIQLFYNGDPSNRRLRPKVLEFVLNGDTLDTSEGRRVQQGLTSMMSPEIGPVLYGFMSPALAIQRMRPVGESTIELIDGDELARFDFVHDAPEDRPDNRGGIRPPIRQQPPGFRRPQNGRPPRGQGIPPGANGNRPGGDFQENGPPFEQVSYWFDQATSRLVMSSSEVMMQGRRSLTIETLYERIDGLDVAVWRSVSGSFPMQRRLRTITVRLVHETAYSEYAFIE